MNNLQIFKNNTFGKVRVADQKGEPWFVAKEIAEILQYKEPHKAVVRHVDEDDRMKHPIVDEIGRKQETWLINERGKSKTARGGGYGGLPRTANS